MTKNLFFLFFKTTKKKLLSQEAERAEKLAEIGTQLRQFREQQSICLIKRYAEAMGLDGAQFANFFPIEPAPRSATKLSWQDCPQLRPMHLYVFYVVLIICSVNGLSQLMSGTLTAKNSLGTEELAKQELERTRLVAAQNQKVDSYAGLEAVRAGESLDKSDNKPVMVNVTFNAESWVQIEVDGKTEFEGTLPSGTVRSWQAQEKLVFVAGNAGAVLIAVNNGQAKQLGAPGVAKEVIFKADELKPSEKPKKEG
jgi:cytoskeletal protein RodZ